MTKRLQRTEKIGGKVCGWGEVWEGYFWPPSMVGWQAGGLMVQVGDGGWGIGHLGGWVGVCVGGGCCCQF